MQGNFIGFLMGWLQVLQDFLRGEVGKPRHPTSHSCYGERLCDMLGSSVTNGQLNGFDGFDVGNTGKRVCW